MNDMRNPIRDLRASGSALLGTYVRLPTAAALEAVAEAGLDFVRFDQFRLAWDDSTLGGLVQTAKSLGLLTWARAGQDRPEIARVIRSGVEVITFPDVGSARVARQLVSMVSEASQLATAAPDVVIGCQVEDADGLANYKEIVAVDGVDVIHTGRTDLSHALGVPGEQFHPRVLEAERMIAEAALDAGKEVSLLYPLTPGGLERTAGWLAAGVRIVAMDTDYHVLRAAYATAAECVRAAMPDSR